MSIRAWRYIFVYLMLLFFLFLYFIFYTALPARAASGEVPSSSGPQVILIGDNPAGGGGEGGSETGDDVQEDPEASAVPDPADPAEDPEEGKQENPAPVGEEETPPVPSPEEEDGAASGPLPELETVSNSGAAVYRLPIAVPPGRNGIDPNLFLTYNSRRRNGPAGVGWNLDLGAIQRSTRRGVDYGAQDFFAVSGGYQEELVPRESDWGAGYYGAKIEETFVKYKYNASAGGWTAFAKDGTRYDYGTTAASRQGAEKGVFKWSLDAVEDSNGNRMTVSYIQEGGQIYPSVLSYPGGSGTVEVRLSWESRSDVLVKYDTGFRVETAKRLQGVSVYTGNRLVRKYALEYETGSMGTTSRLKRVRLYGADGTTALPAVSFGYREGGRGVFDAAVREGVVKWDLSPDEEPEVRFLEADGDGRADILVTWTYWEEPDGSGKTPDGTASGKKRTGGIFRSGGDGTFQPYGSVGGYVSDPEEDIHPGDVNGDGRTDLMLIKGDKPTNVRTFYSIGGGSYTEGQVWQLNSYRDDYMFDFADVNGDGYDDLIACHWRTRQYFLYRSDGNGSFERTLWKSGTFPVSVAEGGHNTWIDLNGDGLTDCVAVVPGQGLPPGPDTLYSCLNNGDGGFVSAGAPRKSDGVNRIVDVTGDGYPDLAVEDATPGPGKWRLYAGRGDGTFSTTPVVLTVPFREDYGERDRPLIFGDVSGDGLVDVSLYVIRPGEEPSPPSVSPAVIVQDAEPPYKLFMTTWKAKAAGSPDLLTSIDQQYGGRIAVQYAPSTDYDNEDLPFVLDVVRSVSVSDGLGTTSVTAYDYEGGYFDRGTREFRGFGTVTKTRPDGALETARYHCRDEYLKRKPYLSFLMEKTGGSWSTVSSTGYNWSAETLSTENGKTCKQVKLANKSERFYTGTTVYKEEANTYDGCGNLLAKATTGTGLETVTESYTYQNVGTWLWRVTAETLQGSSTGIARQVRYTYEPGTGNLLKKLWLNNTVTRTMTYDDYGNRITETDPNGNVTQTAYDPYSSTYPVRITRPATGGVPHITTVEARDFRFGKPTRVRDENGNVTIYGYDVFGRLVNVFHPDGGEKTVAYFDNTFPRYTVTRTKETASGTIDGYTWYDGLGREVQSMAFGEYGTPVVTRAYYDVMGRKSKETGPFFGTGKTWPQSPPATSPWTATTYDTLSRPVRIERADGTYGTVVTTFSYSGFDTSMTDPDGGKKTEHKDALGRITAVTEYLGSTTPKTYYRYNAAGDLLQVTDTKGNKWVNTYDTLGRRTKMTDPDLGTRTYGYDRNGNRIAETDGKGQTIGYAYDALNRLTKKTFSTSDPAVVYTYDTAPNGKGRVASMDNGSAKTTCDAYDAPGRLKQVTKLIGGTSFTTRYAYDLSGKKTMVTYPDGTLVDYTYHSGSNLLWRVSTGGTVTGEYTDYEPTGKMKRMVQGNGTITLYGYDAKSTRLLSIITTAKSGEVLQKKVYQYTKSGNLKQIRDDLKKATFDYTYDGLHRLTAEKETKAGGQVSTDTYSYDEIGNITSKRVDGVSFTYGYDTSRPHAVRSVAVNGKAHYFTYDPNGNLTYGPDLTDPFAPGWRALSWTAENMPSEVKYKDKTAPVTIRFAYDGEGRRTKKTVSVLSLTKGATIAIDPRITSTTFYVDDSYQVVNGKTVKYLFAGTMRIAEIRNGVTSYYHKDHLGSSAVLTDAKGRQIESAEYLPFGRIREYAGTWTTDYKFTDQEMDTESGLYNFNARLYDPTLGRFISPDPAVPDLSDPTKPRNFDPQMLNRYSYCRNNPMIYIDPSGLEEVESSSASSSIGDDSDNDSGGDRSGWGCDTSGFDGATGLVVIGPDGITIVGPGNKKNNNLRYAQVDWPSLNAFQMGSKPRGFFVCDRSVHGILGLVGYNHAYGFSYVSIPYSYGMISGYGRGVDRSEKGPAENRSCGCIEGSIGREQSLMDALMATADEGPWIGFFHDCHNAVERALKNQGFVFPGTPNGRWGGNINAKW